MFHVVTVVLEYAQISVRSVQVIVQQLAFVLDLNARLVKVTSILGYCLVMFLEPGLTDKR